MKFIIFSILILFFIKNINSQIVKGPDTRLGYVNSPNIFPNFDQTDLSSKNFTSLTYARYDWSVINFHLRNNLTGFHGVITLHPRVDEFTTFKIPNTNDAIYEIFNRTNQDNQVTTDAPSDDGTTGKPLLTAVEMEGYHVWVEIPGAVNVTTYSEQIQSNVTSCFYLNDAGEKVLNQNISKCENVTDPDATVIIDTLVYTNTTETRPIIAPVKHILNIDSRTFVPYFTLIIQLDKGNIVDAMWDGDRDTSLCESCDNCIDDQCATKIDNMNCDVGNGCQLKMYVAWAGVDNKNKNCVSINKIPSNFQKYSSTSVQKIGTGLLSDFFYKINDNNNNPNRA